MTDQNPHDGITPDDRERLAASADETADRDRPVSAVRAAEHRSVPASAHANSGSHDRNDSPTGRAPQYGVGPFSIREVALLGIWVVAFLVSFFRTNLLDSPSGVLVGGVNVWLSGLWWIPTIALPTVAVGLLVLRRLSPQGIRRVGSLGIDQFASVAFTVSALVWIAWVWDTVVVFGETGIWTRSWVIWVEAVVLLAGVVLTVFAPLIPPFSQDFRDREDVPAHRNARPIRPVVARPRAPRPPARSQSEHHSAKEGEQSTVHGADAPTPGSYTGSTDLAHDDAAPRTSVMPAHTADDNDTDVFAPLRVDRDEDRHDESPRVEFTHDEHRHDSDRDDHGAARSASETTYGREDAVRDRHDEREHAHAQAFWALAPVEREVVDDYGTPIFRIGPTAWALVVEDRGETFVVRHDDGRIGYLHDVSGVTRG
ncbi:hypothetical protein QE410_002037 [Microbacterium sp. SORGH_AS 1204]|uniref:hypothetical protein n=1 Tax=Microbacterium sp. SORGH_AS_1204 TaxID=3041785 RepID=UPI002791C2DF|nr:hypothetical protein [Microbacterium sp. SORGH_AS_1204]MDQ1137238.1 hypothetical protein [Microbacterium sp. SORGH_AS_1204]